MAPPPQPSLRRDAPALTRAALAPALTRAALAPPLTRAALAPALTRAALAPPLTRAALAPALVALALSGCTPPPPPTVALPADVPSVRHAEGVSVDRFLAPTALGAKDDLLCPWARGEPVPDASLARWTAEKRLTWRVVTVGPAGATLDGAPLATAAPASHAAAKALAERCGTPVRDEVLVAVPPATPHATLTSTLEALDTARFGAAWMLVADASPDAPAVSRRDGPSFGVVVPASGAWSVAPTDPAHPPFVGAPPAAFASSAGCGRVSPLDDATWAHVAAALDDLRGAGLSDLALGSTSAASTSPSPAATAATIDVPLHGTVAALPLPLAGRDGACAAGGIVLGAAEAPPDASAPTTPPSSEPPNEGRAAP